jgi:hypothetical protein
LNVDEAIACLERDSVLPRSNHRSWLLAARWRHQADGCQQAEDCNRRSPDCQVSLPEAKAALG